MHNIKTGGADLAHCRVIRRNGAQLTAQAAGAPTLRAGPSAFTSPGGAALCVIPAVLCTMVQALAGVMPLRRCSAPPGRTQEPPRPLVPLRRGWGSVLAVPGVEGGAA